MNTLAVPLAAPRAIPIASPIALPPAVGIGAGFAVPQNPEVLANSLDVLDVGLGIWDEADRLLLYNRKINRLLAGFYTPALIGKPFETVLRSQVERGLFPAALGQEAQWLSARLAARGKSRAPQLLQLSGHHWIHLHENRTPDGCVVTGWVDVTELVHKRQVLEARNQLLAQQSATDGLTGLANRRRLDQALATEWQRAARNSASLSLLMLDIDHFKPYNDHYGHLAGDECLRRVAERLSQCVSRAGELVARYGGEEFVILLPGADVVHAAETAQRCLDRVQQAALPHSASPSGEQVSLSLGVACARPDARQPASALLRAADVALYRAKAGGRSRFEVATPADWAVAPVST